MSTFFRNLNQLFLKTSHCVKIQKWLIICSKIMLELLGYCNDKSYSFKWLHFELWMIWINSWLPFQSFHSISTKMLPLNNLIFSIWGYSSVVEHSTADREVHGSTPCAPWNTFFLFRKRIKVLWYLIWIDVK